MLGIGKALFKHTIVAQVCKYHFIYYGPISGTELVPVPMNFRVAGINFNLLSVLWPHFLALSSHTRGCMTTEQS